MNRLMVSFAAALAMFSMSAMAFSTDTVDERVNRTKPTSPARILQAQDDVEEFDPNAPDAAETLKAFDQAYRAATGEDTMSDALWNPSLMESLAGGCVRAGCHIWVNVVMGMRPQTLFLYIDGRLSSSWKVSTGMAGHTTPQFEGHPAGPFYPGEHTSSKYPGGDYNHLGNMPYAMMYDSVGHGLHGTGAIGRLGTPASHGCTRMHPDNAHYLNQLVRQAGIANVYFSVTNARIAPGQPSQLMSWN